MCITCPPPTTYQYKSLVSTTPTKSLHRTSQPRQSSRVKFAFQKTVVEFEFCSTAIATPTESNSPAEKGNNPVDKKRRMQQRLARMAVLVSTSSKHADQRSRDIALEEAREIALEETRQNLSEAHPLDVTFCLQEDVLVKLRCPIEISSFPTIKINMRTAEITHKEN
eukprot:scaffold867_cov196-Alexandrium_tamarense.AAC.7